MDLSILLTDGGGSLEFIKAVILGIIQGLSEFLPISSSGHLVLFQDILNFDNTGVAFEVFVHFGTLIAVLVVFRKDVWAMISTLPGAPSFLLRGMKIGHPGDEYRALSIYIVIGSIPAAFFGLVYKDEIESLFESSFLVLTALLVTAIIMWSSRYTKEKLPTLNGKQGFLIGIAQAFAIIPGISRSGSTIVLGLWLGLNRDVAARFSFLLSLPVIFGATIIKFRDLLAVPPSSHEIAGLIGGTIAATISGYFAIIWLLDLIRKQRLEWFGVYCAVISLTGFLILLFN